MQSSWKVSWFFQFLGLWHEAIFHLLYFIRTWTLYRTYKWQAVDDALKQYGVSCSTNFCSNIMNRALYSIPYHLCLYMCWILMFQMLIFFSVLDCYDLQAFIYYLISCYLLEIYLCFLMGDFAVCVLCIFPYCIALMEVRSFVVCYCTWHIYGTS